MVREFRNSFGEPITEAQVPLLDEYTEVFIDPATNLAKIKNEFKNGGIWNINYFKSSGEAESQLVNNLKTQCNLFTITDRLSLTSNYTIELTGQYVSADLSTPPLKSKNLLKNNGSPICIETLDPNTNLPVMGETKKYYYGLDEYGEEFEILEGFYKQDGSLDHIIYKPTGDLNSGQDWEFFDQANFPMVQSYFANDISYFLTATLSPGNLVI